MTTGIIQNHVGGGLYNVKIVYKDYLGNRKDEIIEQLADIEQKIQAKQAELDGAEINWLALQITRDAAISTYNSIPTSENEQAIKEANNKVLEALVLYESYQAALARLRTLKAGLEVEQNSLNNTTKKEDTIEQCWCLDLADGIGNRGIYGVGETVDVHCFAYNPEQKVLAPKNTGLALSTGGQFNELVNFGMLERACMAFYNAAMESGFAKWQPILLKGVLVSIKRATDKDCSSAATAAGDQNDEARVYISKLGRFSNIQLFGGTYVFPVTYFDGSKSFQVGDEVAVLVTNVTENGTPEGDVIGYAHNPKIFWETGNKGFQVQGPISLSTIKSAYNNTLVLSGHYPNGSGGYSVTKKEETRSTITETMNDSAYYFKDGSFEIRPKRIISPYRNTIIFGDYPNYIMTTKGQTTWLILSSISLIQKYEYFKREVLANFNAEVEGYTLSLTDLTSFCASSGTISYKYRETIVPKQIAIYVNPNHEYDYDIIDHDVVIDCNGNKSDTATFVGTYTASTSVFLSVSANGGTSDGEGGEIPYYGYDVTVEEENIFTSWFTPFSSFNCE